MTENEMYVRNFKTVCTMLGAIIMSIVIGVTAVNVYTAKVQVDVARINSTPEAIAAAHERAQEAMFKSMIPR